MKQTNKTIKVKIHSYRYEINKKEDNKQYKKELIKARKSTGRRNFNGHHWINFQGQDGYRKLKEHYNKINALKSVTIETKHLFDNQFNIVEHNLRVYLWEQIEYENANIKEGYYLEMTEELKEALNNTFRCGYCGKDYTKEEHKNLSFCSECLDSEHLTKEKLYLLRLKTISDKTKRGDLNDCDKIALEKAFIHAQIKGTSEGGIKRVKEKREKLKTEYNKAIKTAKTEFKGFSWLMDNGINTNNVIYYSHTDIFCFGWRKVLSYEEEQSFKKVLKGFPFAYELKV